jgi:hypothetical protein
MVRGGTFIMVRGETFFMVRGETFFMVSCVDFQVEKGGTEGVCLFLQIGSC